MILKFISVHNQNGEKINTEFSVPLLNDFVESQARVLEYTDPNSNLITRLELYEDKIYFISGPNTIKVIKDLYVENEYIIESLLFRIKTHLTDYTQNENRFEIKYELFDIENNELGNFEITLELIEE